MSFAPRQNYRLYDAAVSARKLELCRAASESDRFIRYAEYFDAVAEATPELSSEIREQRLRERIATRERLVCAFHERDKWTREKRTPNDTD